MAPLKNHRFITPRRDGLPAIFKIKKNELQNKRGTYIYD